MSPMDAFTGRDLLLPLRPADLETLGRSSSPKEAAHACLQWLMRLSRADFGYAYLLSRDSTQFRLTTTLASDAAPAPGTEPRPLLTLEAGDVTAVPALQERGGERWLAVRCGSHLALRLRLRRHQPAPPEMLAQVEAGARLAGMLADLAHRLTVAQTEAAHLKGSLSAARVANEAVLRPYRTLELLFRLPLRMLGTADGGLVLLDSAEGGQTLVASAGRGAVWAVRILGGGIPGLASPPSRPDLVSGEPLGALRAQGVQAVVRIPAVTAGKVAGCAYYFLPEHPRYVDHHLQALIGMNERMGQILSARDSVMFVRQEYLQTLKAAVSTRDGASPYSVGHSERMAHYARITAASLGLSPAEVEAVALAAYLHDVGMCAIDFDPQTREGQLSPGEYEAVQEHTRVGAELVSPVHAALSLAPIVAHHHERWDGKGYPGGLKGSEIPLGARIIAVCDLFEAKTTGRAYRPPLPFTRAIADLQVAAGTQLDPTVVAAFVRAFEALRQAAQPGKPLAPCWQMRQVAAAICGACPNRETGDRPEACWENPHHLCGRHGSDCPTCIVYTEALARLAGS